MPFSRRDCRSSALYKMKTCCRCKLPKTPDEFPKNKAAPDGRYFQCKTCVSVRNAARREKFPDEAKSYSRRHRKRFYELSIRQRRESRLRKTYGLEPEDFEQLKLNQQNKCAICRADFLKVPCIDHDHATGKVRGLLCQDCNTGLGLFKDSLSRLRAAATYLERP